MTFLALRQELLTFARDFFSYRSLLKVVFDILLYTSFVSTTFSTQPQPWFVFLHSATDSNGKGDKTKSRKHQSHEGVYLLVDLTNI